MLKAIKFMFKKETKYVRKPKHVFSKHRFRFTQTSETGFFGVIFRGNRVRGRPGDFLEWVVPDNALKPTGAPDFMVSLL